MTAGLDNSHNLDRRVQNNSHPAIFSGDFFGRFQAIIRIVSP